MNMDGVDIASVERKARVAQSAIQKQLDILRTESTSTKALVAAGKLSEFAHELAVASSFYKRAQGSDPNSTEALARSALVYLKLGRYEDGLREATQLCQKNPDYRFETLGETPISAMTVLGDALRLNGFPEDAKNAYRKAVELNPDDAYSVGRLAEQYVSCGEFDAAVGLLHRIESGGRFVALISTLKLGKNDPKTLPAIANVKLVQLVEREAI